jgi:hypothetical protein
MNRLIPQLITITLAALLPLAVRAADAPVLTAKLDPSGMIRIFRGTTELAMIELNAHGPQWKHAPQATATAQITDLPDKSGKRVAGLLPVPNTDGGSIRFIETIKPVGQSLKLEYDLAMTQAMKLNGLQFSVNLPIAVYAAKELLISRPGGDPQLITFPPDAPDQTFSGWMGEGYRIELAKGTDDAMAMELRAATDIGVQDQRRWGNPVFEVRLPAITDDAGRDVTAEDRFHLDLTITFAGAITLATN